MSPGWIITLILVFIAVVSFWVTWRMIGTADPGRHAGRRADFDWSDTRPLFRPARPDRVDQLARRWYMPESALEELLRVDQLLAEIEAYLRAAAP